MGSWYNVDVSVNNRILLVLYTACTACTQVCSRQQCMRCLYHVLVVAHSNIALLYTVSLQAQSSMFSVGQVIQATVKELVSFGIVMELAPDVSGLLHIRNLDHAYVS